MEYTVSFKEGMGVNGADLLQFEGFLNIQNVRAIKKSFLNQLDESTALQVCVKNTEQFDLSFLQLLLGLKIRFKDERRPIYFDFELNKEVESVLAASGIGDFLLSNY